MTRYRTHAIAKAIDSDTAEAAAQYVAYVGLISVAVAIAAMTAVFSGQTALKYVDSIRTPAAISQLKPSIGVANFAMLPGAIPSQIRNDVVTTNF